MLGRKKDNKNIDVSSLNEVIVLAKKILKIAFFFIIIIGIYAIIMLLKELKVLSVLINILKVLTPLFIGLVIAWLFDPLVSWLQKKGIKRVFGALIVYLILILIIFIVVSALIPVLSDQINDFAKMIPNILDSINGFIDGVLDKLGSGGGFDIESTKNEILNSVNNIGSNLTSSLPSYTVSFSKAFFSGLGTFVVGLIIGFYLLVSFDNADDIVVGLTPKKIRSQVKSLMDKINTSLRKYVEGTLMLALLVFILSSLGFLISGLKAPLLFGLFCGMTDVIPYLGPYIGGIPAVIVGFSQSTVVGIITLIAIFIIQFIEGNFLQPLIMSKQLKLHPVTIMLGLLVFGYLFGVVGMILATPIMAILKILFTYFDERYNIIHSMEE